MLYLIKALLDSHEVAAAVWIIGGGAAVLFSCLSVAMLAALFHPDPKVRASARSIFKMLLDFLAKGMGR